VIDEKPIGAALSRNLGGRSAPGEKVEAELDAFISKRHDRRVAEEGERPALGAWQESERRAAVEHELRSMAARRGHSGLDR